LLDAMLAGGDGGVCGGANLFPRLYVDLYQAATQGATEQARSLQAVVHRVSAAIYSCTGEATAYLRGLKCAMSVMGLCQEVFAEPLAPLPPAARAEISAFLGAFSGR